MRHIIPFKELSKIDLSEAGGKNASLGEMYTKLSGLGIKVPDGFAITSNAFRLFISENNLNGKLEKILDQLDTVNLSNLASVAKQCRELINSGTLPESVRQSVLEAYTKWGNPAVAVRSSATAEDLPEASFAGQHESFLNVQGETALLQAIQRCYASLFNDRAIKYRLDNKFPDLQTYLSVGVQKMVNADKACAGVAFTVDPESGFNQVIYVTGAWGLGENVVQGAVNPDEFYLFKPNLEKKIPAIIRRKLGQKEIRMMYSNDPGKPLINEETPPDKRTQFILSDEEIQELGNYCYHIEKHYGMAMDIEWAKDGKSNEIYIVQARPETIHSNKTDIIIKEFILKNAGKELCRGKAVGKKIISGTARIIHSLADAKKVQEGDILVSEITNPDWNAMLRKVVGIVTDKGGRTSHASIVARELGIPAIVGCGSATHNIKNGQRISISCSAGDEGIVYEGEAEWDEISTSLEGLRVPKTKPKLILADPSRAFSLAHYPVQGVGLLRMEFIIANEIRIHPMALINFDQLPDGSDKENIRQLTALYQDKKTYFIDLLAEGIATIAAAFWPEEVIVRMSDFKSNEYSNLIGGNYFEPQEANPMIGLRGAMRYYSSHYREGFALECHAIKKVRETMGLQNVKVMIPFCRTVEEGRKVLKELENNGLKRGARQLEIFMMVEVPSNVILANQFAEIFDGFSIGSNDLTQLTLGLDRDSELVSHLFNEEDPAVKELICQTIRAAKTKNIKVGLCGQAPSDLPSITEFLVQEGIDSISFNPDALLKGIENINRAENIYNEFN